jgi:hypothetical protein
MACAFFLAAVFWLSAATIIAITATRKVDSTTFRNVVASAVLTN